MKKTQIEQNKTSHFNPHRRLGIQAARGGAVASNVGRMLEDGMDSSSEKNDVVRHVVPVHGPVRGLERKGAGLRASALR